ncbi:MAG: hypothetical protein JXA96_00205 [Sedimentisphaerales bacterium]|nr:hypothetical protein [Sedimentisphaerales bacterium]
MKDKFRHFNLLLAIAIMFISGCASQDNSEQANVLSGFPEPLQNDAFAQRFQETTPQKTTVVESAIELSQNYAKLVEEATYLKQQNQSLTSRNQELKEQAKDIQNKLLQTQTELKQANEVLVEMRLELNNWKSDVLGYREEMRSAQTAQLQALMKILRALGGEPMLETARSNGIGQAVAANRN